MIFSQRVAQMSKALWKAVEKDWQHWIKPYDLNINELAGTQGGSHEISVGVLFPRKRFSTSSPRYF